MYQLHTEKQRKYFAEAIRLHYKEGYGSDRIEKVFQYIREVREIDPGIGGTKLWHMYTTEFCGDSPIGRDRFCRIIDEYGLKVRLRIRKPRTTDSLCLPVAHT